MSHSNDDMRRRFKEHYADLEPDPATIARLRRLIDKTPESASGETTSDRWWFRQRPRVAVAAACFGIAVLVMIFALGGPNGDDPPGERVNWKVATEKPANFVAKSHLMGDSRIPCADVEDMSLLMPMLDFKPSLPERLVKEGYCVVGADYCSLDKSIAARVRLCDPDGRNATLYMTRCSEPYEDLQETTQEQCGCVVTFWREKGLLFAMATDP